MAQLTVWIFEELTGARAAGSQVDELSARGLVQVHDGALVEWARGETSPTAEQLEELAGPRALGARFWDLIFGIAFLFPLLAGADASAAPIWDLLVDGGIPDSFLESVRTRVVPGTSALWLLGADEVSGTLAEIVPKSCGEPVVATLDDLRQRALHEVFPR
jgi:uncharacterized membrane protein